MNKRLLIVMDSLTIGGAEKQTLALAKGLQQRGLPVHLLYFKNTDQLLNTLQDANLTDAQCLNASDGFDSKAISALKHYIAEHQIDCVISTSFYTMFNVYLATLLKRGNLCCINVDHTAKPLSPRSFKDHLKAFLYRRVFRAQDQVISVSKAQQTIKSSLGYTTKNTAVIYNGVDVEHFKNPTTPEQNQAFREQHQIPATDLLVGICAVLRPEKSHKIFLEAIKRIRDKANSTDTPIRKVHGLLIGDGPERENIEQYINEHNLADSVTLVGFQSNVIPYMCACDAMALPSVAVENFSISALETLSLGIPMIMSDVGGAREMITEGETGYIFPARDIDRLTKILEDFDTNAVTAEACRNSVINNFSEDKMVERYIDNLKSF